MILLLIGPITPIVLPTSPELPSPSPIPGPLPPAEVPSSQAKGVAQNIKEYLIIGGVALGIALVGIAIVNLTKRK